MPFTSAMLLGVATAGFDAIIHYNGSYSSSSGTSNTFDASISGSLSIVSDPKGIIVTTKSSTNLDTFILENSETYEISVIDNFSYSSSSSGDKVGLRMFSVQDDGTTTDNINLQQDVVVNPYTDSGGANNFKDVSFTPNTGFNPGLAVVLNKSGAGGSFSATSGLKLGITKTS